MTISIEEALRSGAVPTCEQSLQVADIPRAENAGKYLAETNDGRLLYLNHANEWQECPNFIARALAAEAKCDALREALAEIIKADTHLAWTGGAVPEPSHEEFGACAEIAARALTQETNDGE